MMEVKNPVTIQPNELLPGDHLGYKVIATVGRNGDWAAYAGLTNWPDGMVASQGDKLSQEAAEALFYAPKAAGLKYRQG